MYDEDEKEEGTPVSPDALLAVMYKSNFAQPAAT